MKSRILFVMPTINSGGAERVAINFANIVAENHKVDLVVFDDSSALTWAISEKVNIFRLRTFKTVFSIWKLFRLISRVKPDVVFCSHSRVAFLLALVLLICQKTKLISRMQGMPSAEIQRKENSRFRQLLYSFRYRASDVVIAQTKEMKDDCVSIFRVAENKIKVIHNPIDTTQILSLIDESSPFVERDVKHIVLSGRIRFERGFDIALRAIKYVSSQRNTKFFIHVIGPDRGGLLDLKALIKELEIGHVFFHDYQSNPYKYYVNCDLFILSSRWEGLPNAFIENVYLGSLTVATRCVPIVEEIAGNRPNIFLCDVEDIKSMGDAIMSALDYGDRSEIGYLHKESNIEKEVFGLE